LTESAQSSVGFSLIALHGKLNGEPAMLTAMLSDALFIGAVFFEALAVLSVLRSWQAMALPEALEPVLMFYREKAIPILAPGTPLVWGASPGWLADASVIAAVFFFQFFILQARRAMAPHGYEGSIYNRKPSERIETLIDWALPGAACAAGALITAPILAPFLTVPAAIILEARRLAGFPSWFQVSKSYYLNLFCLAVLLGGALTLLR
jgi:hypothetical protein